VRFVGAAKISASLKIETAREWRHTKKRSRILYDCEK
jgi:hypothetical protein